MLTPGWGTTIRGVALLCGCLAAAAGAWTLTRDVLRPLLGPLPGAGVASPTNLADVPFDQALGALCAAALLGCVLWLVLGTVLALASHLADLLSPAHPVSAALSVAARRGVPRCLRRLVVAALGVAVTTGAAGPVLARPTDHAPGRPLDHGLSGLALPDRTTGRAAADPGYGDPRVVVVRRGDSLWSIAAERLPPGATDRAVTAAWQRLHRANAGRLGPDPDLILPGTRLDVPDLSAPDREDPS